MPTDGESLIQPRTPVRAELDLIQAKRTVHNGRRLVIQRHCQVEGQSAWPCRGGQIFAPDDGAPRPALCRLSSPRRYHQLRDLAVFPVPAEPSHGRGDAGGSRHLGHIRLSCGADQQPAVGSEIRPRIRQPRPPPSPRPGDKWHLDEVVITIVGTKHWLWRAVDPEGLFSMSSSRAGATRRAPNACSASS
jgi:hypothetical protein